MMLGWLLLSAPSTEMTRTNTHAQLERVLFINFKNGEIRF